MNILMIYLISDQLRFSDLLKALPKQNYKFN